MGPENPTLAVSTGPWEIAQWPWWQWWRVGLEVTWVIALGTIRQVLMMNTWQLEAVD